VAMMHAKQAIEEGIPGLTPEQSKAYLDDKLGVRFKKNVDGDYDLITLDGVLPMADLMSFRQAFNNLDEFMEWGTNMVGGPIKGLMETAFNRDLYSKQLIKKFDGHGEAFQLPWVKDAPSFMVWHPKLVNLGRKTIGKPAQLLENFAKYTNQEIDKDTGKPLAFADTSFWSAMFPFTRKRKATANDIENNVKGIKAEISAMNTFLKQNAGKNTWQRRLALRSKEEAERELKLISAPPGQPKSALPFIP
jgi:hypothetical protein